MAAAIRRVFVTGGNGGIGLAISRALVQEHNCHVFLGVRNLDKGKEAAQAIAEGNDIYKGRVHPVQLDVSNSDSVEIASATTEALLGGQPLYGLVNNAGTGVSHGVDGAEIINTNLYGPKRVTEAFLPLLDKEQGRIVNLGSGAGPLWLPSQPETDAKQRLLSPSVTWQDIEDFMKEAVTPQLMAEGGIGGAYALSKACLHSYTAMLAREHPNILSSAMTPGFIQTKMTEGLGAKRLPTDCVHVAIHLLFSELKGNGFYYGEDAKRSPLHRPRKAKEGEYEGGP